MNIVQQLVGSNAEHDAAHGLPVRNIESACKVKVH
jgi:hypothetical protein